MILFGIFFFSGLSQVLGICRDEDGNTLESGARYNARGFMLICRNGMEDVLGCVAADGTEVGLNDDPIIKDGIERKCFKRFGTYFLDEKKCGEKCGQPKVSGPRFEPGTARGAAGSLSAVNPLDKDALVEQTFVASKESTEADESRSVSSLESSEIPHGARVPSGGNPKFKLVKSSEKSKEEFPEAKEISAESSELTESAEEGNQVNETAISEPTTKKFPHGPGITPSIKKLLPEDTPEPETSPETSPETISSSTDSPETTQSTKTSASSEISEEEKEESVEVSQILVGSLLDSDVETVIRENPGEEKTNQTETVHVSTSTPDSGNGTSAIEVQNENATTIVTVNATETTAEPDSSTTLNTTSIIVENVEEPTGNNGTNTTEASAENVEEVAESTEKNQTSQSVRRKPADDLESSNAVVDSEDPDIIVCKHKDGRRFFSKEEWLENGFRYQCQSNGLYRVIGCASPNAGAEVPLGHALTVNGWHLNCTAVQGRTFLEERFIGRGASGASSTSLVGVNSEVNLDANNNVKCVDDNGTVHNLGDEWITEKFKFRCDDNGPTAMACLTRDGHEIPINSTKTEGDKTMSCKIIGDSLIFKETPILSNANNTSSEEREFCNVDGEIHDIGEKWSTNQFSFKCKDGGFYQITGCVSPDGTEIEINTNVTLNGIEHRCYLDGVLAKYEGVPVKPEGCVQGGDDYEVGETWTHGGFRYKCVEGPELTIVACLTDNDKEIEVGETKELDGLMHSCTREDNKFFYKADLIDKSEIGDKKDKSSEKESSEKSSEKESKSSSSSEE